MGYRMWCGVLLVGVLALLCAPTEALPSWQCRICEDVTNTWHDHFPCAGGTLNWGNPLSPDIHGCEFPVFDCNKLNGQLKAACFGMVKQFSEEVLLARKLWETMMLYNKPYETCIALGKCEDETGRLEPTPCHQAFLDPYCKQNWQCKNFTESCDETCYLCTWLVRDWPLFQESCKPTGAALPQSVPMPSDRYPKDVKTMFPSFIQMEEFSELKHRRRLNRALRAQAREQAERDRLAAQTQTGAGVERAGAEVATERDLIFGNVMGKLKSAVQSVAGKIQSAVGGKSKGLGEADSTRLVTGFTRMEECFTQWNLVRRSAKARYFTSWKKYVNIMSNPLDRLKGEMWDANIACKCLGKCELNRYEDLGLVEACRYDDVEQNMMQYIFKNNGDIAVVDE